MITFQNKKYELLFSNNLSPLVALNYADELFFKQFKKLSGKKYRILSIIRNGKQEKYGLKSDLDILEKHFLKKTNDYKWPNELLESYQNHSDSFKKLLTKVEKRDYKKFGNNILAKDFIEIRQASALLDAMSNMLYLFSVLAGEEFSRLLKKYSEDKISFDKNFIYYTQPIIESRFAKIKIRQFDDRIKLSKSNENFSKILRLGAYIKDDVSYLLELRIKKMAKLIKEIAKRLKCAKKDLEYLQSKEIENCLFTGKINHDLLRDRKKITLLFYPKNSLIIYEGDKANLFLKKGKIKEIVEKQYGKNICGQTASLGHAIGQARVCFSGSEANKKIKPGDILVSIYTDVSFVPAMRKAGAIVTETGGITSHAAIISREFKKPCVIGTKIATKVLKDGDLVEVDADKGAVKIIK